MKTVLKKVLILLLICFNLYADKVDVTLRDFANIVATQNNINILISSDIEDDKILFLLADKSKSYVLLPAFQEMLLKKDLHLVKNLGFYSIDKISFPEREKVYYSIPLKNLVYPQVKKILDLDKIDSVYINTNNSVGFYCVPKDFLRLRKYITDLDIVLPQVQFKINIFYTNTDELKERGFNLSSYAQSVENPTDGSASVPFTYFLNLITMPYNSPSNILDTAKSGFYGVVKYLNQNGFTKIENSPILTAKSHSKVSFSNVQNLPYKTSATSTADTTTTTVDSIAYKDVGLKIELSPIVLDEYVNFDLDLIVEEVINSSITPTTEKRQLNSSYSLKRGEILVLSGVNKSSTLTTDYGIPLLKEIWFLGNLFKYKSETVTNSVLTITIEVL